MVRQRTSERAFEKGKARRSSGVTDGANSVFVLYQANHVTLNMRQASNGHFKNVLSRAFWEEIPQVISSGKTLLLDHLRSSIIDDQHWQHMRFGSIRLHKRIPN